MSELSPEFLKYMLDQLHADKGKFLRIADLVLVGPAEYGMPGTLPEKLGHDSFFKILEQASPDFRARLANAQTAAMLGGRLLKDHHQVPNGDGVEDAGFFLLDKNERGHDITTLKIGGRSGTYGMADPAGREETLRLVRQALGPGLTIEEKFIY